MGLKSGIFGVSKRIEGAARAVGSQISYLKERNFGKSRNEGPGTELSSVTSSEGSKLIAVVGRTGSGLSQFIHDVTDAYQEGVAPDSSMQPYTQDFKAISTLLTTPRPITRTNVIMIDTPGFDYSRGNDEDTTLRRLAVWVKREYGPKAKLDGVIYMHNIWNEEIYNRSKFLSSPDLEKLCGPCWHRKVIFISSHWSEGYGADGDDNERKLREGYWSFMIRKGSGMRRYESPGNQKLAREILIPFL